MKSYVALIRGINVGGKNSLLYLWAWNAFFFPRVAIRSTSGKQGFIVALPEKALVNVSSCKAVQLMALDMKKKKDIDSLNAVFASWQTSIFWQSGIFFLLI